MFERKCARRQIRRQAFRPRLVRLYELQRQDVMQRQPHNQAISLGFHSPEGFGQSLSEELKDALKYLRRLITGVGVLRQEGRAVPPACPKQGRLDANGDRL